MYLDEQGKPTRDSVNGPRAAGIPGVIAALDYISAHYGNLDLATNLAAAIKYAREGFVPGEQYQRFIKMRASTLSKSPAAHEIFIQSSQDHKSKLVQKDLAYSLELIAEHGQEVFYHGELAATLVQGVQQAGGIWQLEDLHQYKIKLRTPIKSSYKDLTLVLPPPPTSGGVVVTQILSMLDSIELDYLSQAQQVHVVAEAMRRAYQDRAVFLGDPDFTEIPMQMLLDKQYAQKKFETFDPQRASVSQSLADIEAGEGQDTTHFSVIDAAGNYVAATLSINYPFGSGFVAPGTGILLNDEMDDFAIAPGVGNVYGLVGSEANAIEPGKRMLSSMTPLFAYSKDRLLIAGTPGGSRIISMLALALIEFQQGASSDEIVSRARFHHQYMPDVIQFEKNALSQEVQQALIKKGHTLKEISYHYGNMQVISKHMQSNNMSAASDPRGEGLSVVQAE
jgi:gamma-glutamyltranspeptidase/glutathione hydrolase